MTNRPQPNQPPAQGTEIAAAVANIGRIIAGDGPEESKLLVEHARQVGRYLQQQRLTTGQIRNIFGTVRSIESTWRTASLPGASEADKIKESRAAMRELNLLKPRMAYAASRNPQVRPLAQVLEPAIGVVLEGNDPTQALTRFNNFLDFFEAILAYHREAGGH